MGERKIIYEYKPQISVLVIELCKAKQENESIGSKSCPSPWIFLSVAMYALIIFLADTTSLTIRCRLLNTSPVRRTSRCVHIVSH